VQRYDYTPFGTEWQPAAIDRETRRFTAHEWDAETGLGYFGARSYGGQTGRFTVADDAIHATLNDPQSLNLYAYARNNPLGYIDPDGRQFKITIYGDVSKTNSRAFPWYFDVAAPSIFDRYAIQQSRARPEREPLVDRLQRCASDQLGLSDALAIAAVAAGQPIPGSKRFVIEGSSKGTSLASKAASGIFGNTQLPFRMPTIVGGPGTGRALAIAGTKSVARFAGRAVPIIGWAILAYDAASIALCTAQD
jgi:RHS repeat-associated protein